MTRNTLLKALCEFCQARTSDLQLPTSIQKGDTEQEVRAPEVYRMRLPDSSAAKKVAPYILLQFVSGVDKQPHGNAAESTALVRFIFCVYSADEQEGAEMLLNVMDAVRIGLLKQGIIGKQFKLDYDAGLESLVYADDTAPYYAGEMVATFLAPPVEREVNLHG